MTEYLVKYGYAAKDKVFAEGGSAGGLLMGAIANMAPQDYRGIVAHVPFVDVVTTMLDDAHPADDERIRRVGQSAGNGLLQVHAVVLALRQRGTRRPTRQCSSPPACGTRRCSTTSRPSGSRSCARTKTDTNPLLLKVNMDAGHGGKSGRFQRYREVAEEFAFLIDQLPKQ